MTTTLTPPLSILLILISFPFHSHDSVVHLTKNSHFFNSSPLSPPSSTPILIPIPTISFHSKNSIHGTSKLIDVHGTASFVTNQESSNQEWVYRVKASESILSWTYPITESPVRFQNL